MMTTKLKTITRIKMKMIKKMTKKNQKNNAKKRKKAIKFKSQKSQRNLMNKTIKMMIKKEKNKSKLTEENPNIIRKMMVIIIKNKTKTMTKIVRY